MLAAKKDQAIEALKNLHESNTGQTLSQDEVREEESKADPEQQNQAEKTIEIAVQSKESEKSKKEGESKEQRLSEKKSSEAKKKRFATPPVEKQE